MHIPMTFWETFDFPVCGEVGYGLSTSTLWTMTTLELFLTITSQVSWEIVLPWKWFVTYLANVHPNCRCTFWVTSHGRMKFAVSLEGTIPGNHKCGTHIKNRTPLCCYPHHSCRQNGVSAPHPCFILSLLSNQHTATLSSDIRRHRTIFRFWGIPVTHH